LRRHCLLKQVLEGEIKRGIEMTGRRGRRLGSYWMTLKGKERMFSSEGGSSRSQYVKSSLWKRLWICF
jgi:hypothetical protein